MSIPLATIFHGDVTLEQGSEVNNFGWGDLSVNRRCTIHGTENSTSNTDGALIVAGGIGITKTANIHEHLNVLYGTTNLTETHIDTTNGPFTVTGGNKVFIEVGSASQFVTTGNDTQGILTLSSLLSNVHLYGGGNSSSAVDIQATNVNGGINLLSGSNSGQITLVSGSGGISGVTSHGNISLTANNANGSFIVNSSAGNQNLTIGLQGTQNSQLKIESAGSNETNTALVINTSDSRGNIRITNFDGLGTGSITQLAGSGGYALLTNTGGTISLTSQGASSSYTVQTDNSNQHLSLALEGETNSSVIIKSSGTNPNPLVNQAIQIYTTHPSGIISINQTSGSIGKVDIFTGSGGFIVNTATGGSTFITTYGASSTYTNSTLQDNQDLNITVTGNTNSKVNIASSGTSSEAIKLSTSQTSGGIYLSAGGKVQIESNDGVNGVKIATNTLGIPVHIGTSNSMTTIYGDLNVKGVTTTIQSSVVTVNDNIMIVNNAPSGTSDGGLAVKRYQSANDTGSGDVVQDTPDAFGIAQGGNATSIILSTDSNPLPNYYNGWWVKITVGTGMNQVRRIKNYLGAAGGFVAHIYNTADHDSLTDPPVPREGMDFITNPVGAPDPSPSEYSLYPCGYVMMIWDETNDEFAFVCNNNDPGSGNNTYPHYSDVRLNNLAANNLQTNTINGSQADITAMVTLNNNSTTPVFIPEFPNTYGIYLVFVKPLMSSERAHAIFMIGKANTGYQGTIVRIISAKGNNNDQLDMQWPHNSSDTALSKPQLFYRPYPNGIGGSTVYKVKIVSL
jgi:hypothetical protein